MARAAVQIIRPPAANELVAPLAAVKAVGADAAEERVAARAAPEPVAAGPSVQSVRRLIADDFIIAAPADGVLDQRTRIAFMQPREIDVF